ncbi:putative quinol monooxygenase [Marinomonas mediterranea]|jgi:Uncharacterized conserved protein|uniref:Antibiotic biosynthesis monooxygenase n=1 Tax=Marinomonas mediterranea (strain ATCC 700492 / JCM 21426 / NBRC 103028 / MMB-1) TaxID=717774 RepID=F2K062_MARM1|nr:antibiotic biosynthesis monooxygenase [Marinomonas mediterranea]ADZ93276.1 Antibiotic biosynthesis monooxygenase [Marinomonas mediterranea MMB-1]WCN11165.1 carboxymuconolactone decarboxylase [Marinomonas mediterranea]WCN15227.1 carboxymuconolactone decarboxylase [Marinomonas mediterranea]WCN19273.1 carboxymuconolactone decarboxylase [Marinomonas mediterranea MMB-1]
MSDKIEITAFIQSVPGKAAELKQAIIELIKVTVEEPGCEVFKIFQCADDPERFVLWEVFSDAEAMKWHMEQEYTKEYFNLGLAQSTTATRHVELVV